MPETVTEIKVETPADVVIDVVPSNDPATIIKQQQNIWDTDIRSANALTTGYYSRFNTNTAQSFTGTVIDSLVNGAKGALPESFKTDVSLLSDFRLGAVLRRRNIVSGDLGTLIDGAIDFVRPDKTKGSTELSLPKFSYINKFIPIVIKTEFKLKKTEGSLGREHFYIVFDSTPDKLSFSKNASWTPKEIYGRPEPLQIYASSGAVTFSLTGMFFSDSEKDHANKMELENRLFALVTPSKNHFMPSPVEVRIGEWKRLRCIVTSVSIDTEGPWRNVSVPYSEAEYDNSVFNSQEYKNSTFFDTTVDAERPRSLPSHSPYLFSVNFNFTVVSEYNTVQYAEDIMDVGFNGGYSSYGMDDTTRAGFALALSNSVADSQAKYKNASITYDDNMTSIVHVINGKAGDFGTLIKPVTNTFNNTTEYLRQLGLPTDANNSVKTAALAQISSGLSAIIQTNITKKFGTKLSKLGS